MNDALRCPFCEHEADGLTLYLAAGAFRLLVCEGCYRLLIEKEHQPYSQPMQRVRRLVGLNGKEVVSYEGPTRRQSALGHGSSAVAQAEAQHAAGAVAEPGVGFVSRNTHMKEESACAS